MIDNIQVGKTIARLRQNKNMTQQQLAAALSVSHQAVSKWETGAALPDVQTLVALTRLFGITIEQLLEGEVLEDRVEPPKPASPFDEPIQNIGNFVNNIVDSVGSIFRSDRKDAGDDGARDAEPVKPVQEGGEGESDGQEASEAQQEAEPFDVQTLLQMAPFMTKAAVDELLLENRDKLTPADIARFAPFASQECLEKLIQTNDEQLDWDALRKVAPFLKREMVDNLARAAAKGGRTVKRAVDQSGINTDELGRTMQDVGQKIGAGVEKALRKASKLGGEMMEEMSSAINDIVEGVKEKQSRAEALRRAACERALQDENWEWLADHVADIKDEELLREIAQKANSLGMHDWVLEHLNGYADTRTIDAAIEAGNWGWLGDHVWQFEDELQEKIARAAAKQENWQWLATYAEQISLENCADEIAIAAYKAEARVLATQIATHCASDAQREKLADVAVEAGDFDYFEQLVDILSPAYIGRVLVAAAQAGEWERVKRFAEHADADSIAKLMELAIAEGNFDAIDALDKYL
ncbi:MAG: helix-turn-helix transcriptional regulator [Clostridia bacterium]|nr:helix-turn-helix transcriptional regulator [Clostridia bacterium]